MSVKRQLSLFECLNKKKVKSTNNITEDIATKITDDDKEKTVDPSMELKLSPETGDCNDFVKVDTIRAAELGGNIFPNEASPPSPPQSEDHLLSTDLITSDNSDNVVDAECETLPSVYSKKQWEEKKNIYPWLDCKQGMIGCSVCAKTVNLGPHCVEGVNISNKWKNYLISSTSIGRENVLTMLRNKIRRHKSSYAHQKAVELMSQKDEEVIINLLKKSDSHNDLVTERVLRTVYYIAKNNRPFSDHPDLIELQKLNSCDLGLTLHSRFTATNMINLIATEMRKKIVENIIKNNTKIVILSDESTSLGKKSCLIVYLRSIVNDSEDPVFIFLGLVELEDQTANGITLALEKLLLEVGFKKDWLIINWVGFVCDGASVLLGKNNGVAKKLSAVYTSIFTVHCMNHRIELAINDAIKVVSGIDSVVSAFASIYSIYSMSPKNSSEIKSISEELNIQFLKIGKVFDVRWVASSRRSIKALWTSYPALVKHFERIVDDPKRGVIRSKCEGLLKKLTSAEFVNNLGILYDILTELGNLSEELQSREMTLCGANYAICRSVRVLQAMKSEPGLYQEQVEKCIAKNSIFKDIQLTSNKKISKINSDQLYQSVIDNLKNRLLDKDDEVNKVIEDCMILDPKNWPPNVSALYGQKEVLRLCKRFNICEEDSLAGMKQYVDKDNVNRVIPIKLKKLKCTVNTLSCGSSECERGFSQMNLVCTDIRSKMLVSNLSSLLFININGPPIHLFNPSPYVKLWLRKHKHANDNQTRKVETVTSETKSKLEMYKIINS